MHNSRLVCKRPHHATAAAPAVCHNWAVSVRHWHLQTQAAHQAFNAEPTMGAASCTKVPVAQLNALASQEALEKTLVKHHVDTYCCLESRHLHSSLENGLRSVTAGDSLAHSTAQVSRLRKLHTLQAVDAPVAQTQLQQPRMHTASQKLTRSLCAVCAAKCFACSACCLCTARIRQGRHGLPVRRRVAHASSAHTAAAIPLTKRFRRSAQLADAARNHFLLSVIGRVLRSACLQSALFSAVALRLRPASLPARKSAIFVCSITTYKLFGCINASSLFARMTTANCSAAYKA